MAREKPLPICRGSVRLTRNWTICAEYSTAVHEAGHVIVAWEFGLKTRRMAVGINGDPTAGEAEIQKNPDLPLVDRIAICSAGADAQEMCGVPTHLLGPFMDMNEIRELIEDYPDDEGEALRYAGCRRSKELLTLHRAAVERLARVLAERSELNEVEIEQILDAE
jgi:ATP-dependent Zn protease